MKYFVFPIYFLLLGFSGLSQSNIRLNNYWENTYYINPASVNSEYRYLASGAARSQWLTFPGAPTSEYFSFASRFYTNKTQETQIGQFGIKVYHDLIGYTTFINISPSFSYSIRMYNNWRINFGAAYKIQNISYDFSKAVTEEQNDPVIGEVEKKWSGNNMDLGMEFISNTLVLGISSQNLISLFNAENSLQTNTNFLYGMYKREIDSFFNLLLGICAINNENIYQAEFNVSGIVNSKNLPVFQLGVFYRTKKEVGALFGIDLSKTVRLAMSYDYHVGDISHSSFGTPEVLLLWKFGKLKNCDCEGLFK